MLIETNARPDKAIPIDKLDFYLCPKCATNTIRYCQYLFNGGVKQISDFRDDVTSTGAMKGYKLLHLLHGEVSYEKEREDSIKVAVVRDPIERFVSSLQWVNYKYNLNMSLEEALEQTDNDIHFFAQSNFYGTDSTKYDHIISPNEITSLIKSVTGKDLGTIHKGRNPKPISFDITKELSFRIADHYRVDYDNGYC